MYYNSGRGYTAALAQERLDDALATITTVKFDNLVHFTNEVNTLKGQVDALTAIETDFAALTQWAAEKGWDDTLIIAEKLNALTKLALRRVDDTWSGRTNEAKRAYADGWREAVENIWRGVQQELSAVAEAANEVTA